MTASRRRPRARILDADVVYRWREHRASRPRSAPGSTQTSDAEAFDLTVELEVDLDGEPLLPSAPGTSGSRATSSDAGAAARLAAMSRPRISAKAERFTESVIREMNRLAVAAGAVSLAQGFPDFACPPELKDAAARGRPRRHQPVRDHLGHQAAARRDRGHDRRATSRRWGAIDPETQVTVTCGATEAMIAAMLGSSTRATRSSCSSRTTRTTARTRSWPAPSRAT